MKIGSVRWAFTDQDGVELPQTAQHGYAVLVVDIDGTTTFITPEQKLLSYCYPAVYIGGEAHTVDVAGRADLGTQDTTFKGYTDDPRIVELTRDFLAAVNAGVFLPQLILDGRKTFV